MVKVKMGQKCRDKVTGFEGVVVAIHEYLYGCRRISLQPESKNGEWKGSVAFDEPGLEVLDSVKLKASKEERETGGPNKYMPKNKPTG